MPRVEFEPTISVFERAKIVHAAVIGFQHYVYMIKLSISESGLARVCCIDARSANKTYWCLLPRTVSSVQTTEDVSMCTEGCGRAGEPLFVVPGRTVHLLIFREGS
jgi:hypothetical protein